MATTPTPPPPGVLFEVDEPQFLGEMGIRVELFSEPFRMNALAPVRGLQFTEAQGVLIVNRYAFRVWKKCLRFGRGAPRRWMRLRCRERLVKSRYCVPLV